MEDRLLNENIFNRCIFKKATEKEMIDSMEYYTKKEEFEKCVILKELLKLNYYIDDPVHYDIEQMNGIINKHKNDLDDLSKLSGELTDNDQDILEDIDDISDDIITNILESDKLRNEYLQLIYDEITNIEMPLLEKDKHKDLLKTYRLKSIENLKKILK